MDVSTLLFATNALTALVCLALVSSERKVTSNLLETQDQIVKLNGESARLLQANEDLEHDGITDDRVRAAVYKDSGLITGTQIEEMLIDNPNIITPDRLRAIFREREDLRDYYIDMYLKDHCISHNWEYIGNSTITISKVEGEVTINAFNDNIFNEKCLRCGLLHRYFKGSGSPETREYEGYFMGGHRLNVQTTPQCVSHQLEKTEEA